jgi:group I intron endonuclease
MKISPDTGNESGVYQIRNLVSGSRYIGSAKRLRRRAVNHISDLRQGKHHNPPLSKAWAKYGGEAFLFEVLESCGINELYAREQAWMDALRPEYNAKPNAEPGWLGQKMPREAVEKMRQALKGRALSAQHKKNIGNARRGQKRPAEVAKRIADSLRENRQARIAKGLPARNVTRRRKDAKLSEKQVQEIQSIWVPRGRGGKAPRKGPSFKEIAQRFGISYGTARKAALGIGVGLKKCA